ncbi:MAG: metallophosphoesterase, partial [Candidatus Thorarchaeota archaeon]
EDKMPLFIDKDRKEIAFCLIRLIDDENRTLGIFPLYHRSYYIIDEERSADSLFIGMIKNLSPNKKYKYRIECYKKTCGTLFASTFLQEFKTSFDLKEANDTLFFSIISDLHAGRKSGFLRGKLQKKVVSGNKDLEKVFSNIALTEKQTTFNRGYNLSIATGDLTENSSYTEYWADLFKRASRLWNHVPVFTTLGNHDYYTGGTGKGNVLGGSDEDCRYWHRYITNPVSSAGCLPGHWYSLDQGNVHLVFLDSNGMGWGKYSLDCQSEQWLWLENDLKNWRDKIDRGEKVPQFCIVFFHSAIVSCGYWGRGFNWGNDEKAQSYLTPLFRKYGVHLVSFGHDHLYQRSEWLGTTYLANGRSGGMLRPDFFWLRRRVIFNIKRSCGDSKTRVFTTIYVPPNTNYRSQQDLEKHENFKKQIRKELLTIPTAKFFVFGTRTLTNRIGRRIDKNKQIKEKIIDDFIMKKLDDHIWLRAYAVDKYKPIEKEELFDSGFIPVKINTLNENYQITCPEKVI